MVGVLPTLLFFFVSVFPFTDGSVGSAEEVPLGVNGWLTIGIGIVTVLLFGALCGVLTWAAAGVEDRGSRIGLTTLMLLVAAGAGAVVGVVGGFFIALVRYPPEMEDH